MTRPIRPTDLFDLQAAGSCELHPDGTQVVFTISWPDLETDSYRSNIHLHDGASSRQLSDGHSDTSPTLSPDGTKVAFLRSAPKGKPQPMVLELSNGELTSFDPFADGVVALSWAGNANLVVLATERPEEQVGVDDEELERRPRVITRTDYRSNGKGWVHDRPKALVSLGVASGTRHVLTDAATNVGALAVSPDGTQILTTAALEDDRDLTGANSVLLLTLDAAATGVETQTVLTPTPGEWTGDLGWLDDGRPFAVGLVDFSRVALSKIYALDPTGMTAPTRIGDADVNAASMLGTAHTISISGAALGPGIRGGKVTIDRHDLVTNTTSIAAEFEGAITSFASSTDGTRIVATVTTPTRPAELWELTPGGTTRLVELNAELLAELDLAPVQTVSIPSTDGANVEAFVCVPPASAPDAGTTHPGLVYVHGGPLAAYGLGFFDEFQIAAAEGYVVIGGNPRGSDGYGQEWAQAPVGRFGTVDWDDVTAITDYLEARDDVDPDKIGIGGGSYGGFMTAWAIGSTNRYKAALIERCVVNWESFVGTSDIGTFFSKRILGATIESDVDALRAQSPIHLAANVTTPSLILHSDQDWRCPPEQAEQLFVAYRRNGVDVTLVRFPGENHELSRSGTPRHRLERFGFIGDFYRKHLR